MRDPSEYFGILAAQLSVLALASACSPVIAPSQVVSATTDARSASVTPQAEIATQEWSTYQDSADRFSFEYPAYYDEPKYQEMGCGLLASENSLSITPRIFVAWKAAGSKTLAAHVADFISATAEPGVVEITKEYSKTVGGVTGREIEYHFGDAHRLGLAAIILYQDTVYRFEYTDSLECYIPNKPPSYLLDVYARLIRSFRFIPGS